MRLDVISFVVVFLAVFIRLHPYPLLRVPKIGYILYHVIGGGPIPPYVDPSIWNQDDRWLQSGDVVIAVTAKAGTTWAAATVHSIRARGDDDYDSILDVVPWAEFVRYPGEPHSERIAYFKRARRAFDYAVYKSHEWPAHNKLTFRDDVKYLVGVRNPIDTLASLRPFFKRHTEPFARLWGGCPNCSAV
jgi:hypothetical protein